MKTFCESILSDLREFFSVPNPLERIWDKIVAPIYKIDGTWAWVIIIAFFVIVYILRALPALQKDTGGEFFLYRAMQEHGADHYFTRTAVEKVTADKMKEDGYVDPFVKVYHTVGDEWQGDVSWGHTETNDYNCCKITVYTDGYDLTYTIGESKF